MDIETIKAAFCDPAVKLAIEQRAHAVERDCVDTAVSGVPPSYLYEARCQERAALWTALDLLIKLAQE